jgi:hypothetical protein
MIFFILEIGVPVERILESIIVEKPMSQNREIASVPIVVPIKMRFELKQMEGFVKNWRFEFS